MSDGYTDYMREYREYVSLCERHGREPVGSDDWEIWFFELDFLRGDFTAPQFDTEF